MTTLYLASGDGPMVGAARGDRWFVQRPLDVRSASCIAVDPHRPGHVFCTTAKQGAWRSDDNGATWREIFIGAPHDRLTCVTVSAVERGVVYVGAEPSAVYRSEDGGETWRTCDGLLELPSSSEWSFPPRPHTHHVRWIEPDVHVAGRLYVAIEAGALVRSFDGGQTWHDRVLGGPYDTHQMVTHRSAPEKVWSAAGDGFFVTDDGGENWREIEQGLRHRYCWSLAISHDDPGTMLLSSATGPREAHDAASAESHLYRRSGGEAWQEIRQGLPDPRGTVAYSLCHDPTIAGTFYAATAGTIYRSTDAGQSWQELNVDWPAGYTGQRIHVISAGF